LKKKKRGGKALAGELSPFYEGGKKGMESLRKEGRRKGKEVTNTSNCLLSTIGGKKKKGEGRLPTFAEKVGRRRKRNTLKRRKREIAINISDGKREEKKRKKGGRRPI